MQKFRQMGNQSAHLNCNRSLGSVMFGIPERQMSDHILRSEDDKKPPKGFEKFFRKDKERKDVKKG